MTWTKLSDDFTDDPTLLALPRTVRLVHIEAMVWSNRHGTDGRIPTHALPRVTDDPDPAAAAEQLVAAGKWKLAETGWEIVGFLEDQPSAEEVRRTRDATRDRQRRLRKHRSGDHSSCDPRYCKDVSRVTNGVTHDVTNGVTNAVSNGTPTRPDPTRPDPKESGPGRGPAEAARPGPKGPGRGQSSPAANAGPCNHWNGRLNKPNLSADGECLRCKADGLCPGCVKAQLQHGSTARCHEHRQLTSPVTI